MAKLDAATKRKLAEATTSDQAARLRALLLRRELLQGYSTQLTGKETVDLARSIVAAASGQGRSIQRQWTYDSGASMSTIGRSYLTRSEKATIEEITPINFSTANGIITCTSIAWCKVPQLGKRRCYVLDNDCSPLVSVGEDVNDYGNIFYWNSSGPVIETSDGKTIRLICDSMFQKTHIVPDEPDSAYSIIAKDSVPSPANNCNRTTSPEAIAGNGGLIQQAGAHKGTEPTRKHVARSAALVPALKQVQNISVATTKPLTKKGTAQAEIAQAVSNDIEIPRPGGDRHNAERRSTSAKHEDGGRNRSDFPGSPAGSAPTIIGVSEEQNKPFFLEVFSGSGHLSKALRVEGLVVYEIDITDQGGHNNVLKKQVFAKLLALINHPMCQGVWFGFPCGTFSAARRHDGGPPPLRGENSKDIWGLPGLQGRDKIRVQAANKLLQRMNELMRAANDRGCPFYLEKST